MTLTAWMIRERLFGHFAYQGLPFKTPKVSTFSMFRTDLFLNLHLRLVMSASFMFCANLTDPDMISWNHHLEQSHSDCHG